MWTLRPSKVDACGVVDGVPYHDGVLIGVQIGAERTARFTIVGADGRDYAFVLRGVRMANLEHFVKGNIILTVYWRPLSSLLRDEPDLMARFGGYLGPEDHLHAFEIDCSYGARVVAICDGFDIEG